MRAPASRNCTDWYPLLDLCAYNQCLIADRGVYDAATPNGRLLLGMKGMVSEVELHLARPPDRGRAAEGAARRRPGPPRPVCCAKTMASS